MCNLDVVPVMSETPRFNQLQLEPLRLIRAAPLRNQNVCSNSQEVSPLVIEQSSHELRPTRFAPSVSRRQCCSSRNGDWSCTVIHYSTSL